MLPRYWESDFIKGNFNGFAVGTRVELETRVGMPCLMGR
jgi:hypothetical protein